MNKEQIADLLYKEIRQRSKTASAYGMCDNDIDDLSNFVVDTLAKAELLLNAEAGTDGQKDCKNDGNMPCSLPLKSFCC